MAKVGPKLTQIDWTEFDKLCEIQCTMFEIAGWFRCSEDTIERAVRREKGMKFADYYEQKKGTGRVSLRRLLFRKAQEGNPAILIWLSKQHLGMSDKLEQKVDGEQKIDIKGFEFIRPKKTQE